MRSAPLSLPELLSALEEHPAASSAILTVLAVAAPRVALSLPVLVDGPIQLADAPHEIGPGVVWISRDAQRFHLADEAGRNT